MKKQKKSKKQKNKLKKQKAKNKNISKKKRKKNKKGKKSATVAGLTYGDFCSICLVLSSRLYYRYFGLILCVPAAFLSYYNLG